MANIKLKDAFGAETVFHGIKQLKIPDADGGAAEFNLEAMTQEKTGAPDGNGGNPDLNTAAAADKICRSFDGGGRSIGAGR